MRKFRLELYKGKDGDWHWRSESVNSGDKTANGGEGYKNRAEAFDMAKTMLDLPSLDIDSPFQTNKDETSLVWFFERE